MNSISFGETYNKIIRKLTSIKWLQKWSIDKLFINKHIRSKEFTDELKNLLEQKDFTSKRSLNLCKEMLEELRRMIALLIG